MMNEQENRKAITEKGRSCRKNLRPTVIDVLSFAPAFFFATKISS